RPAACARRLEHIVLRDGAARRQCPALSRYPFKLAAQLHLLLEQDITRPAVLRTLIGKVNVLKTLGNGLCQCDHVDFLRCSGARFVAVSVLSAPKGPASLQS